MNPVQQYLNLYEDLSDPKKSVQANRRLIEVQGSNQSWVIAKSLLKMSDSNNNTFLHGCQLLSKKLNRPYYEQQEQLNLIGFIYSLDKLNETLFYCLAKLHLHLDLQKIRMDHSHNNPYTLIYILSQIPQASKVIAVAPLTEIIEKNGESKQKIRNSREHYRSIDYFNNNQHLLIEYFPKYPNQIIKCIDNYVSNNFKINDPNVIRLLLTQQISDISSILQNILITSKHKGLNEEIYSYLVKNGLNDISKIAEIQDFFCIYVAFCSNLDILELKEDLLIQIIGKILEFMKLQINGNKQAKYSSLIQGTFNFWSHIVVSINKNNKNGNRQDKIPQIQLCCKALLQVWKIILEKCLLTQLPQFRQDKSDPLVISLDGNDDDEPPLYIQANVQVCSKFRNSGQDFVLLIFNSITSYEQYRNQALSIVYQLTTTGNPLNLELAIFVISSIIQNTKSNSVQLIGSIIQSIVSHQHAKLPYVWQQLIKLMSRFGAQTTSNVKIVQLTLLVLRQSLMIPELSSLASETFSSIIISCQQSSVKSQLTKYIEQFINVIYQPIYLPLLFPNSQENSQKLNVKFIENTFQNLTKAIFVFIYSFNREINYFGQYLQSISKIMDTQNDTSRKIEILGELALAHSFINQESSKMFSPIFSSYQVNYIPMIQEQLFKNIDNKQKHKKVLNYLALIIGAISGYSSANWAKLIVQLLQVGISNIQSANNTQRKDQIKKYIQKYVTLAVLFLKVENHQQELYFSTVSQFASMTNHMIINLLQTSKSKEYELISQCINYQFQILKRHIESMKDYNPELVFSFIKDRIIEDKNFWEYSIFKTSLAILRIFVEKNYQVQPILDLIVSSYPRLADCFWKSLEAIIYQAYKKGGIQVFQSVFYRRCKQLLPPNPLFNVFGTALTNSDSKTIKNLLANIQ